DGVAEVRGAFDAAAVDGHDDVADLDAGLLGRRAADDFLYQCALRRGLDADRLGRLRVEVGDADAEQSAAYLSELQDLVHDRLGDVGGNGEADADVAAAVAEDRRVDADQLAPEVDQRAAG